MRKFAAEGCNVAINYVSAKDKADELAEEVQKKYEVKTVVLQAVSDPFPSPLLSCLSCVFRERGGEFEVHCELTVAGLR